MLLPNSLFGVDPGRTLVATTGGRGSSASAQPKITTFPNGMRFIYEKSPSVLPLTSIQCFVHVGSANEPEEARGVSHLLEHMCFKGTKRLPKSTEISRIYDETGAYMNAYTVKQLTCYVIKCKSDFVDKSVDVLSDMMFNSTFDRAEYEKEYDVVVEEARKYADDKLNDVQETIDQLMFSGSSYAEPIDKIIYHTCGRRISYDDMVSYYKTYYVPENMVLSIVSSLDYSAVLRAVKNTYFFGRAPRGGTPQPRRVPVLSITPQNKPNILFIKRPKVSSTIVAIGFRTCSMYSLDKYAINLLKHVFIGPTSSYFFDQLRTKNGLTYSTSIHTTYYENTGQFVIYTQVAPEKLIKNGASRPGLLPVVFNIIRKLKKNGISKKDFDTAKGYMQGVLLRNLEDNDTLADHNGMRAIFYTDDTPVAAGAPPPIYSYRNKYKECYEKLSREDLNRALRKYFCEENLTIVCLGSNEPGKIVATL